MRDLDGEDPYELLGVDRTAGHDAIVSAYRRRIRTVHPDLPTGDVNATRLLHAARDILLDPLQRAEYDRCVIDREPPAEPGYAPPPSAWDADDVVRGFPATPSEPSTPPRAPDPPRAPQSPWAPQPPRRPYPPPPRYAHPPPVRVPTNLAASIVAVLFFWPLAIPALASASRAASALRAGDHEGARLAAADSRRWSRLAFIIGGVWLGLLFACCCGTYLLPLLATSSVAPTTR